MISASVIIIQGMTMEDYIMMNGSYEDFEYVTLHFLKSDPFYQESIKQLEISDEVSREIHKRILFEIAREAKEPGRYTKPDKEEIKYQLQFGDSPVLLPVKKTFFRTLAILGNVLFNMLGEVSAEKKYAIITIAVYNLVKHIKDSIVKIGVDHYCVYMFCQKCASENRGIIELSKLVETFEKDGFKCRGWPIYPNGKQEGERCKYQNDDETCKLKHRGKLEEKIRESLSFFMDRGVIEPVGDGVYRLSA